MSRRAENNPGSKWVLSTSGRSETQATPKVVILIPCFRPLRDAERLRSSIRLYTSRGREVAVYCVLDAGNEEEREFLRSLKVNVITSSERLLWTRAALRTGLRVVLSLPNPPQFIVFANQDLYWPGFWEFEQCLSALRTALQTYPQLGVIAPLSTALPFRGASECILWEGFLIPREGCVPFVFAMAKTEALLAARADSVIRPAHFASDDVVCWLMLLAGYLPAFHPTAPGPEHRFHTVLERLSQEEGESALRAAIGRIDAVERGFFEELRLRARRALYELLYAFPGGRL